MTRARSLALVVLFSGAVVIPVGLTHPGANGAAGLLDHLCNTTVGVNCPCVDADFFDEDGTHYVGCFPLTGNTEFHCDPSPGNTCNTFQGVCTAPLLQGGYCGGLYQAHTNCINTGVQNNNVLERRTFTTCN